MTTRERPLNDNIPKVLTTEDFVKKSHAHRAMIPKGNRLMTLKEAVLNYRHNPEFRELLWKKEGVWADDVGHLDHGNYQILDDGKFVKPESVSDLEIKQRMFHFMGRNPKGPVLVKVDYHSPMRLGLVIYSGEQNTNVFAPIAYVKDDSDAKLMPMIRK